MPAIRVTKDNIEGRSLWRVSVLYDAGHQIVRWGETVGGALRKLAQETDALDQLEKVRVEG